MVRKRAGEAKSFKRSKKPINSLSKSKHRRPHRFGPVKQNKKTRVIQRKARSRSPVSNRVSVVVIATNHDSQIRLLLRTVKQLALVDLIVIVSGSQDRTFLMAREERKAIVVNHPALLDWEESTALGRRLAKSNHVVFVDASMPVTRDSLQAMIPLAQATGPEHPDSRLDQSTQSTSKTSIIIPTHNAIASLKECLGSVQAHTKTDHEVVVVDNGSTDGTVQMCLQKQVLLVSLPENTGYPRACNLGMKAAAGSELLLLNNDVVVTEHWLENMRNCLYSAPDIGIVGPMTNYAFGVQRLAGTSFQNMNTMHHFAAGWNRPSSERWREVKRIIGFCLLMKRTVMTEIGELDERFTPGYYEDDDYCYRVKLAGFRILLAGDVFVYHYGSHSFGRNPIQKKHLLRVNHRKFKQKWGFDPLLLRHETVLESR